MRELCGVQLKDRKRSADLMFMLGLCETMEQLVMANSVHWYGHSSVHWYCHILRSEDGHVLRRALNFEVEGQRKKGLAEVNIEKAV